jgi:hypothetical protein
VDRFSNHHFEHSIFMAKSLALAGGLVLIRYCDTRFGLYFLMLHRLSVLEPVLKAVIHSPAYLAKKFEGDEEALIIDDSNFWADVNEVVKLTWPLMQLTRLGDQRVKPSLYLVYKLALLTEERLVAAVAEGVLDGAADDLLDAFRDYKDDLCSDMAMAASLVE